MSRPNGSATGYTRKESAMRNIMRAAVFLILLTSIASAAQNDIVGKWAANGRTRGGLGGMWIFELNGSASLSFGALVDFRYSVKDHILKTVVNDPYAKKIEEDSAPYQIIGDTLITNPTDTMRRQEMKRIGSARVGLDPIVGIWTYKHYTGGMATMEFTSTGLAQLSVPFETQKGRYTFKQQELIIDTEGKPTYRRKIRIENDTLIFLPEGDKKEERYTRVRP
jgi:hypothetical protein